MSFDVDIARRNMITQQVRAWNVLDEGVLELLQKMPREEFVPTEYSDLAFADMATPIMNGVNMFPPKEEGKILQALKVKSCEFVLEVGTGSGYFTALLASEAKHVVSVEICKKARDFAKTNLVKQAIQNVTLEVGDGSDGWLLRAPYDVIVMTASMPKLNRALLQQLNTGGRLFVIVGCTPAMQALLIEKISENDFTQEVLYETVTPVLEKKQSIKEFTF